LFTFAWKEWYIEEADDGEFNLRDVYCGKGDSNWPLVTFAAASVPTVMIP
jgi:hypothetical protein